MIWFSSPHFLWFLLYPRCHSTHHTKTAKQSFGIRTQSGISQSIFHMFGFTKIITDFNEIPSKRVFNLTIHTIFFLLKLNKQNRWGKIMFYFYYDSVCKTRLFSISIRFLLIRSNSISFLNLNKSAQKPQKFYSSLFTHLSKHLFYLVTFNHAQKQIWRCQICRLRQSRQRAREEGRRARALQRDMKNSETSKSKWLKIWGEK